jgi:hypothetical protein
MTTTKINENSIQQYLRCRYLGENLYVEPQSDPEKNLVMQLILKYHIKLPVISEPITVTKENFSQLKSYYIYTHVTFKYDTLSAAQVVIQKRDSKLILYDVSCSYNPQRDDINKLALVYSICKKLMVPVDNVIIYVINKTPKLNSQPYHFIRACSLFSRVKRVSKKVMNEYSLHCNDSAKAKPVFGSHCFKPKKCRLFESCWKNSSSWEIFKLTQLSLDKKITYFNQGIVSFKQFLATNPELTPIQRVQIKVDSTKTPYINKEKLNQFLAALTPSYHCLDIEVLQLAIPLFKPYKTFQKLPILYSIHTHNQASAKSHHADNLFIAHSDFRYEFACELIQYLNPRNKIVVFDSTLEKQILTELSGLYPKLSSKLTAIKDAFLDLAPLFVKHHIILPGMNGKASLKAVLPCIKSSLSYASLSVKSGFDVVKTYKHIAYNPNQDGTEISKKLRQYCALDTQALIEIIDYLKTL